MTHPSTDHLTVLGNKVDGALGKDQLETFDAPKGSSAVEFTTHEFTSFCPVTHQPDLYTITITFIPNEKCVESKSLKLYLQSFRDTGIFGEAVATTICDDLYEVLQPQHIKVKAVQQIRGGLQMTAEAIK